MRASLTGRLAAASLLLALVVSGAFSVLFLAIASLHRAAQRAERSQEVISAANKLERLVVDLAAGQRGYLVTGQPRFLRPWRAARAAIPAQADALRRLVTDSPGQEAQAGAIGQAIQHYIAQWSVLVVDTARTDLRRARALVATGAGESRVNAIRGQFDRFNAVSLDLTARREAGARASARHALELAVAFLAGSLLLILVLALDFARAIARRDVSQRRRAEAERAKLEAKIQQAQKLESLGLIAGGIAHDFNNLLVGILGNASLALDQLPPGGRTRKRLERIELAGQRAAELAGEMLAYAGKASFSIEPVDLSLLVAEMPELLKASISKHALGLELAEGLPAVEADATQLRQVVLNLLTNAAEALGEETGLITIRTGVVEASRADLAATYLDEGLPAGRYVYLEVSDTGCGMDEDTKRKIFDPFFTTKFTGRGLGLAAVLGIVRSHRGAISVAGALGQGTTFRVLLPARVAASARDGGRPRQSAAPTPEASGTVLVVDDEETVLSVAEEMLGQAGYSVLTARDGLQALEVFRARHREIAAVLLDVTMPGLSAEETYRELLKIAPNARIVLTSGYDQQEALDGHSWHSAQLGFIRKPYRATELVAKLREAVEE